MYYDRPYISLLDTKGVINYADLVAQERKKRHPPADPSTTTSTTDTPSTPPLSTSVEEASLDTVGDESLDAAGDESVDADVSGVNASAGGDEKKMSPKRNNVCTSLFSFLSLLSLVYRTLS